MFRQTIRLSIGKRRILMIYGLRKTARTGSWKKKKRTGRREGQCQSFTSRTSCGCSRAGVRYPVTKAISGSRTTESTGRKQFRKRRGWPGKGRPRKFFRIKFGSLAESITTNTKRKTMFGIRKMALIGVNQQRLFRGAPDGTTRQPCSTEKFF